MAKPNPQRQRRSIPFIDNTENMLLIEEMKLNAVMIPTIKARAAGRTILTEDTEESINIPGPSLFFTWWPEYGPCPQPGDWIDLSTLYVLSMDDYLTESKVFP